MSAEGAAGPVPALELRAVVKRYRPSGGERRPSGGERTGARVALAGVDLALAPGQVLALLGPNGAGKTTLVSVAAGLLAPDAGEVLVQGAPVRRGGRPGSPLVGLAPQDIGVYPTLTVAQNLRFFGELAGLPPATARRRAGEVAGPMRLEHLLGRTAGQLSGGERRRLHTAVALVHRPPVVLLDEPTAGADVEARSAILAEVRDLAAAGAAVLYTTHYLGEVEELAADVAVLVDGRITARGTVAELVAAHTEPTLVLAFDGEAPALDRPSRREGATLSVPCPDPVGALAEVLAALGPGADRLASVEVVHPSLEAAYRRLTATVGVDA